MGYCYPLLTLFYMSKLFLCFSSVLWIYYMGKLYLCFSSVLWILYMGKLYLCFYMSELYLFLFCFVNTLHGWTLFLFCFVNTIDKTMNIDLQESVRIRENKKWIWKNHTNLTVWGPLEMTVSLSYKCQGMLKRRVKLQ